MKKKFLALFVTLALILAPAAFAASAVVPCYRGADAAVVSPLEGEDVTPDDGTGDPNPDDGTGDPNPDDGTDGTPEEPEVPAVPLDTSFQTNLLGFVVLGLVAVCALFALILCICGKRKIATVTKKKKA